MHYKNWQIYLNFLVFNLYGNKTNSEIFSHLANNYLSKTSFWYLYSLLGTYFTPFSTVSIVDFEQETVCWVTINFWNHFISIYITDQKILMNLLIYPKGNLQYFEKIRNRKKNRVRIFLWNNFTSHNSAIVVRGRSRTAATSKMERFVITVNG